MKLWQSVNRIGIAIWNYSPNQNESNRLSLCIGELVHIYEECDQWFHGYSLISDANQQGIFPKNFILAQEYETQVTNIYDEVYYKFTFEQEAIFTLREWAKVWKQIYIKGDLNRFYSIRESIIEIIDYYRRIKSGKLTSDELKNLKIEIIEKFDFGNSKLGLDLKIRNIDGFTINPLEINIIEYFRMHQSKHQKTKIHNKQQNFELEPGDRGSKNSNTFRHSLNLTSSEPNNCYSICVTLYNFICTVRQDMDILMSIYDAKANKFISENYIVKWDRFGLMHDIDKLNNTRIVFTDLSRNDLKKKLFLVCQIIRIGTMSLSNNKTYNRKTLSQNTKKTGEELKRPCGIAVYDLSEFISKPWEYDENREIFFPFIQYCERDSLDSMIRKTTNNFKDQNKEFSKMENLGFRISIRIISSYKMKFMEQYSVYYSHNPSYISRKIGFPDIILPEDVRNDLYLTLASGEFNKGSKKSERNIEVTVRVFNSQGQLVENCLSVGPDNVMQSLYRSVVYYHEEKPKWMETIKISLSIEQFCDSHLKFTFKHRSSNENKDKNEKPFGIAFIKLMNANGTTLKNNNFDVFVYKIDGKKFNDSDLSYLTLPSSREDLDFNSRDDQNQIKNYISKNHPSNAFVFCPKDLLTISIVVCSTKLAQNINIFGLLNWKEKKDSFEDILKNILKLDGGDVVKFLHDALDALFEIWMDSSLTKSHDKLVFDALVHIIELLLHEKYMHFQEILNDYIDKNFSATLVFNKLIENFKFCIMNPESSSGLKAITCMEYIFKFIVRSRTLFALLNNDKGKDEFEMSLEDLLKLFNDVMDDPSEEYKSLKCGILQYFPKIISNLLMVFDNTKLTNTIVNMLYKPKTIDQLYEEKLSCMHNIIFTPLFADYPEHRKKILPVISVQLYTNLVLGTEEFDKTDSINDTLKKCLNVISDILTILTKQEARTIKSDILEIISSLLETLLDTFQSIGTHSEDYRHHLWSIIIALLNHMTKYHYTEFFKRFTAIGDLRDFVSKLLKIFQESSTRIYPRDWNDMNIVQNIVILKSMNLLVECIKERMDFQKKSTALWTEIFLTAIKFITQPSLQLEDFSKLKRKRIKLLYKDMRIEMVTQIRSLWYYLGNHKKEFIPTLIGPLLEVSLIPVLDIRQCTVIIFFDQFSSCFDQSTIIRNEVITQLDSLITRGKGDSAFQSLFEKTFLNSCENHPQRFNENCHKFVNEVSEQIEKLLTYRNVVTNEDNSESLMSCIIDLLDFYERIDRKEMYIRYLYKLYDLHIKCENFNEAAYTLSKHGMLLDWSDRPLESLLRNEKYSQCNSHRELKEQLYYEIVSNFDRGQLWEAGIVFCKELVQQYENVFFDYVKLSNLFLKMSTFYNLIVSSVRIEPEYFHVTYIGNGFPSFFRGKSFIYRGKGYERLLEFTKRLQSQFPSAQLLNKLDIPEELLNSDGQHLSIYRVDPVMNEVVKHKFHATLVDEKITSYYKFNQICDFTFSRKILKKDRPASNEFACMWIERSEFKTAFSLPGILCRSEIIGKKSYELNPLKNAIDTMEKVNDNTRSIICKYLSDHNNELPFHVLLMHINGIVNSDVQGGVAKYEEAFFQPNQSNYDAEDIQKLKNLIASQIPLLNLAIKVADEKQKNSNNREMDGLYHHLLDSFYKMREDIEGKYGKCELPVDLKKIIENHYKIQNYAIEKSNSQESQRNSFEGSDGSTIAKSRSIFGRSNGTSSNLTNTLRFRRKESRRVSSESTQSIYASNSSMSKSHWYTDSQISINVSDVSTEGVEVRERKRPTSGHYSNRASIQSHLSFCRTNTSLSTLTLANGNEKCDNELEVPPPLPVKQSAVEYKRRNSSADHTKRPPIDNIYESGCQIKE